MELVEETRKKKHVSFNLMGFDVSYLTWLVSRLLLVREMAQAHTHTHARARIEKQQPICHNARRKHDLNLQDNLATKKKQNK